MILITKKNKNYYTTNYFNYYYKYLTKNNKKNYNVNQTRIH